MLASQNGHQEVVTLLLEKGADIHAKDNVSLSIFVYIVFMNICLYMQHIMSCLLSALTQAGWTALFYAANEEHTAAVKLLVEKGVDIAAVDNVC